MVTHQLPLGQWEATGLQRWKRRLGMGHASAAKHALQVHLKGNHKEQETP